MTYIERAAAVYVITLYVADADPICTTLPIESEHPHEIDQVLADAAAEIAADLLGLDLVAVSQGGMGWVSTHEQATQSRSQAAGEALAVFTATPLNRGWR